MKVHNEEEDDLEEGGMEGGCVVEDHEEAEVKRTEIIRKMFSIPIIRPGDVVDRVDMDAGGIHTVEEKQAIASITGPGFKVIRGYILLDSDDPLDFLLAFPKELLDELLEEHVQRDCDRETKITFLLAMLQPNYMVCVSIGCFF